MGVIPKLIILLPAIIYGIKAQTCNRKAEGCVLPDGTVVPFEPPYDVIFNETCNNFGLCLSCSEEDGIKISLARCFVLLPRMIVEDCLDSAGSNIYSYLQCIIKGFQYRDAAKAYASGDLPEPPGYCDKQWVENCLMVTFGF